MDRLCRKAVSLLVAMAIVVAMAIHSRSLDPLPAKGGAHGGVAVSAPGRSDSAAILGQKQSQVSPAHDRWKPQPTPAWAAGSIRPVLSSQPQRSHTPVAEQATPPAPRSRLCRWLI